MAETWIVTQGAALERTVTLRRTDRTVITGTYTGGEVLALVIGYGDDRAPLAAPLSSATWSNATNGLVTVALSQTDTAAWPAGLFRGELHLTSAGRIVVAHRWTLDVLPAAGTATAAPSYCTWDDLLAVAPWLKGLVADDPTMQSDLAEQRGRARTWFEGIIHAHDRPASAFDATAFPLVSGGVSLARNPALVQQLVDDLLIVTPDVRRANALYAVAETLAPLVGKREASTYQELADQFRRQASDLAGALVVELDTNADGYADVVIDLGTLPGRRG
jgi:hypothetical protein